MAEETYLAALARERVEDNKCVLAFVDRMSASPQEWERRLAKARDSAEGIHREMLSYNRAKYELQRLSKMPRADQAKMEELRGTAAKALAAVATYESSIPLSDLDPVKELLKEISSEVSNIGVDSGVSAAPAFDKAAFDRKFKQAVARSREKVVSDNETLKKGIASRGAGLDRYARESLAQDHDLVEKYLAQNPSLRASLKGPMCAVDAKYGSGAEMRDEILLWGSVAMTAGSFGVGLLGRASLGAAAVATTPVRIAASAGSMSARMARLLGTPTQFFGRVVAGVDLATGMNQIAKSCLGYQAQIKTKTGAGEMHGESERCRSFSAEDLDMQDCVRDATLTALGVTLSTPMGQRLAARALGSGPRAAAEADPLKPPAVSAARPKTDLPPPPDAERLSQAESDKFWRERSYGYKKEGFSPSLQSNLETAIENKTSYGRFMERLGYVKGPNGQFKKPSLDRVLKNYNDHIDDLIRKGVVKEDEVIRPVALFRDADGNFRTLRIGERVPKGWKYTEELMEPDAFMDLIAKGEMPIGGFKKVGRFDMVAADHDINHLAAFAMNPKITKDVRQAVAEARAAQDASAQPELLRRRLYMLMEHGHYVPASHRSTIKNWEPKLFSKMDGPQPVEVFQKYVESLPKEELDALAQRVAGSSPRITRHFGGLQIDEMDGAVWGIRSRSDLTVGRAVKEDNPNYEWILRRNLAQSLQENWNGTYIEPRTMVRDFIDPTTPSGQRMRRLFCMNRSWSAVHAGDVDGFNCDGLK